MKTLKHWWRNTDSIEVVLFASLAFCIGWGIYQMIIGLIGRFF